MENAFLSNSRSKPLSDEELVLLIRKKDQKAFSELVVRFRPMIQRSASAYFGVSPDPDDLFQEGILALLSAAYTYSPQKSAAFRTYAAVCINNRFRSYVRDLLSQKNLPMQDYVPLEEVDIPSQQDPAAQIAADEAVSQILQLINTELSPLEKKVLRLYLQGLSYAQIAQRLSVTQKSVNNALLRLRGKLKSAMGNQ